MATKSKLNLDQIAAEIRVHLKGLERDEAWNVREQGGMQIPMIFSPNVWSSGMRVVISYVDYQSGDCSLSRADAIAYLEWLDAGNKGTHITMQRESGASA